MFSRQILWQLNFNHYFKQAWAPYCSINKSHHILKNRSCAQLLCINNKRGLPGAARDYVTISLWHSPVQIDLRTQRALGWGEPPPTNKIFIHKPTPRSNFCLLAPVQFSKHTPHLVGWTLRAPGLGEPPTNKILLNKPTPRSFFAGPHSILYPSGFFRRGHYRGYPQGSTFWVTPVPSPGEMRSPRQILGW